MSTDKKENQMPDLNWQHDVRGLWAESLVWTDDGWPLLYRLECDEDTKWCATFDGTALVEHATLSESIQACDSFDKEPTCP